MMKEGEYYKLVTTQVSTNDIGQMNKEDEAEVEEVVYYNNRKISGSSEIGVSTLNIKHKNTNLPFICIVI